MSIAFSLICVYSRTAHSKDKTPFSRAFQTLKCLLRRQSRIGFASSDPDFSMTYASVFFFQPPLFRFLVTIL
jgi:hypothetical protein